MFVADEKMTDTHVIRSKWQRRLPLIIDKPVHIYCFRTTLLCGICLIMSIAAVSLNAQQCETITRDNRQSAVHLEADKADGTTGAEEIIGGSGFIVSAAGVVLTNRHVITPKKVGDQVTVSGAIGSAAGQLQKMHLLAVSESSDLALLQFDDTSKIYKPVTIGNPINVDVDHPLCSMSFPLDIEFLIAKGTVTGKGAPSGWWYSNIPSNPGDSGAPVFDANDGKVIAVKVGDRNDATGLSYVIPINQANTLLLNFVGLEVPQGADRRDTATSSPYLNSEIDCVKSTHPFARDYCSVVQCPNGQWVRASAKLLLGGDVVVTQGLETDRLDYGICGWAEFKLLDESMHILAYGYNSRACIPAKLPGPARIENLQPTHVKVPAPIANKASSIQTTSYCAGDQFSPLGLGNASAPPSPTLNVILGAPPQ
jgi:hypothetical protein